MRTFDSSKYNLIGFEHVSTSNLIGDFWMFETKSANSNPNFQKATTLVDQARWITDSGVFYLKSDGTIENRSQELCVLPLFVNNS